MTTPEIEPDGKDWTWVLDRPCPECGYDATVVTVDRIPEVIRDNATTWQAVLTLDDAAVRPDPATWSPLEYSCHLRDVHRVFDRRVALMLEQDEPRFPDWDQDETAIAERYAEQDPATVAEELLAAAAQVAERYESVPPGAWDRRGLRSNGSEFTIESIGLYHLHDIVHHAWDVRAAVARATVEAYDASAVGYRDAAAIAPEAIRRRISAFAAAVGPGGRVLEIGSAGGRDAALLDEAGLDVRCTDITPAFVDLLRSAGRDADRLDPLHDDLDDPLRPGTPYDGVWANACLLHVSRTDLPVVLARLAAATRPGGVLGLSMKQGDGEAWSTHGRVGAPRHFTFWQEASLREALEGAGWQVRTLTSERGSTTDQEWLLGQATRSDR